MSSAISPSWMKKSDRLSARHGDKLNAGEKINIKSPLLFDMLSRLSITEQSSIFDAGQASSTSLDYLSHYKCKLFINDFISSLDTAKNNYSPEQWNKILHSDIQFYNHAKPELNMIFLWGLPNYLTVDQLQAFVAYLLPYASSDVLLHAYIFNTHMMPSVPANYHIRQDHTVDASQISLNQTASPQYHLADLNKCCNPLRVERSVMLSSGVQEYLFSF